MFAVGHLALGYLTGKATSKLLNVDVNISLLFLAAILPDIDLLIPGLKHRGPTHSLIIYAIISVPTFILCGKRTIPYFMSLTQHSFFGDLLTGGVGTQILWPVTLNWYGAGIKITSLTNIYIEWIVFLMSLMLMLKTKDIQTLFQHHPSNLLLSMPVFTILLPTFLGFPIAVPLVLTAPHLTYLTIFAFSIIIDIKFLKNLLSDRLSKIST